MALVLWLGLGLGRKPEERPEVDEGEREGAALLVGVLRGLLEVEQPRAGSCRADNLSQFKKKTQVFTTSNQGLRTSRESSRSSLSVCVCVHVCLTSLRPPLGGSFFAGVSFAGGVFSLGRLSGLRLTFST